MTEKGNMHKTLEPGFYKVGELVQRKPRKGGASFPQGGKPGGVGMVLEDPSLHVPGETWWAVTARSNTIRVLWLDTGGKEIVSKKSVVRAPVIERIT